LSGDYITTYTGVHFTPFDPDPEDIRIIDIAHALSLMTRANGHLKHFYSVGQHSINCALESRAMGDSVRIQLACLLHDASEVYISDITRPVKKKLQEYQVLESKLQSVIYKSFGLELTMKERNRVAEIDDAILWHEFAALMEERIYASEPFLHFNPDFSERRFADVEKEFLRLYSALTGDSKWYKCVGIDGTRGGWMAACLDGDSLAVKLFDTINELCAEYTDADCVLIDIPIGLPESKTDIRPDGDLRKRLKGKASSVFNTPCRQAVYEVDYQSAKDTNIEIMGKGLSQQSFAISNKIRETDKFLQCNPAWQNRLLESHPEYGFAVLNAGVPVLKNKKTKEGSIDRISILKRYVCNLDQFLDQISQVSGMRGRFDDVLDALCLSVIGNLGMKNGFKTVPDLPAVDSKGLKMQIVFPEVIM